VGKKEADLHLEFGLINSMIRKSWKKRTRIINVFEQNGLRM